MADSGVNIGKEEKPPLPEVALYAPSSVPQAAPAPISIISEEALGHGEQPPPYSPNYGTGDAVPPSYEGAATSYDEPPPSYDSLYGQIREAKQKSSGFMDFMKTFFIIIISTIGCTICVGLVLAIPIAMIVIGAVYLNDCPAERFIPIYLIVGGVFGAIKNLSNMGQRCKNRQENDDEANAKTNPFDGILGCFLLAWFIAGNVWIYRVYGDTSEDSSDPMYCHPVLYDFAFWLTTVGYILMATACCCFCFCGCLASCFGTK